MVEQPTVNRQVVGSTPTDPATIGSRLTVGHQFLELII